MYLNLAAYRFADLDDLPTLRARIDALGRAHGVRGTVLLAPEGLNLYVSAPEGAARAFLEGLRTTAPGDRLAGLEAKESWSADVAFDRWRVRVKREIITFRQPTLRPADGRAPAVAPRTLARWLDAGHDDDGRALAVVDTRNGFEVDAGAFDGAIDLRLHAFTDFAPAIDAARDRLAGRRVVTYCTGGIRCEKAALMMQRAGIEHVVQLEGGVLRYFEQVGGAHWHGELFVFDKRVGLSPALAPSAPGMRLGEPA
jgi:UPF0176 protein